MNAIKLNEQQLLRHHSESEAPILVEYQAPWCVYCRRIGPAIDKIAEQFQGSLSVATVDIDENPLLAAAEQIEVIPTLVIYQRGKALGSVVAPDSKAAIERFIRETLGA